MPVKARPQIVTGYEVARQALGIPPDRITHVVLIQVGKAMKKLGFSKKTQMLDGVTTSGYVPNKTLTDIEHKRNLIGR